MHLCIQLHSARTTHHAQNSGICWKCGLAPNVSKYECICCFKNKITIQKKKTRSRNKNPFCSHSKTRNLRDRYHRLRMMDAHCLLQLAFLLAVHRKTKRSQQDVERYEMPHDEILQSNNRNWTVEINRTTVKRCNGRKKGIKR